jgi:heme-degrading monooxygenase HmoA
MPVLEVCQLRLRQGVSASDDALLKNLSAVRATLKTNSRFYHCIEDPSLIYILGIWPTLDAHKEFLASPESKKILGSQDDQLEFQWMLHMELEDMELLPLDAPVMAIARLFIKGEKHIEEYQRLVDKYRATIADGARGYKVVHGWRYDVEPGKQESLMFSGWESLEAHKTFTAKMRKNEEYASLCDNYEGMEVRHARDMEN